MAELGVDFLVASSILEEFSDWSTDLQCLNGLRGLNSAELQVAKSIESTHIHFLWQRASLVPSLRLGFCDVSGLTSRLQKDLASSLVSRLC